MFSGLKASEFDNRTECVYHELIAFADLLILRHDSFFLLLQAPLHILFILIQLYDIFGSSLHDMREERLMHYVRHTIRICLIFAVFNSLSGNQHNRNLIRQIMRPHIFQYPETVKNRHDNVQQDQYDIFAAFNLLNRILPIFCLKHFVFTLKYPAKYLSVYFFIIHNQYLLFIHDISLFTLF